MEHPTNLTSPLISQDKKDEIDSQYTSLKDTGNKNILQMSNFFVNALSEDSLQTENSNESFTDLSIELIDSE